MERIIKVLFICIGNTCRSPMAEAVARALGKGRIEAFSAGLRPTGVVVAETLGALKALDYEAGGLRSKGLHEVQVDTMDVIISLVGDAGLAYLPRNFQGHREAWSIPDPYGEEDGVYHAVARLIEDRVKGLVGRLQRMELDIG